MLLVWIVAVVAVVLAVAMAIDARNRRRGIELDFDAAKAHRREMAREMRRSLFPGSRRDG